MAKFDQLAAPDYPVFLGAKIKHPKPEDAFFHVLPIPFEASASAAGTGDGPKSILAASWLLESWDGRSDPCKLGIYTHKPVDIKGKPAAVIGNICEATLGILKQKKFPVGIGGEHSSTFGIVKAFIEAGVEDFGVVQIDAHANLRDEYEGDSWNHQCVMKRIVDEDIPVFQLGVRTLAKEEHEARKVNGVKYYDAEFLVSRAIQKIDMPVEFPDKVLISVDVSGLDPAVFPGMGNPVPGGLGWYQTLSLIDSVVNQTEVIGFDINEFAPLPGFQSYQFAAAMLTYKIMGIIQRSFQSG